MSSTNSMCSSATSLTSASSYQQKIPSTRAKKGSFSGMNLKKENLFYTLYKNLILNTICFCIRQ